MIINPIKASTMSHDIIIDPTIFLTMQHFAKVQNHKTIFSLLIVDVIVLPTNKLLYRFFFAIFNLFCILNK